jgi:2-polyprenyl-6-methoxyphenol hydroxylase-like FAD-dependent oxidoreductase
MTREFDIVTVGGGLGGAAFAKVMAEQGARVLVVEPERRFRDRVRGEFLAPWGVAEAHRLGIADALVAGGAHEAPWLDLLVGGLPISHRNLRETTPQQMAPLCFQHAAMQEAVLEAAGTGGAEVWRGARVRGLGPGPAVAVERDGREERIRSRLVVGADGRTSAVRRWADFATRRAPDHLRFCGVLLDGVATPADTSLMVTRPGEGRLSYVFPQGGGRARAYFGWHTVKGIERMSGAAELPRFIAECVGTGASPDWFAAARMAGPLATFDASDSWVDHPYRDGVALIGDAASTSDPHWGQGMSHTLRDVRLLSGALAANDDWEAAGHAYAAAHDRTCEVTRQGESWVTTVLMDVGPESDRIRERALPLLAQDPSRFPDYGFSGPDGELDDEVRQRFYGEI